MGGILVKKGEVWWVNLPEPIGKHPVVILSRDIACAVRNAITVAEITSTVWDLPVEVPLDQSDGLPKKCVVNVDTIVTIRKSCFSSLITTLSPEKIQQINKAIRFALDL